MMTNRVVVVLSVAWLVGAASVHADPGIIDVGAPATSDENCTGVDDLSRVNAALAQIPAGGGVLYFRAGIYCLSNAILLPARRIHLRGAGMEVTKLIFTGSSHGIVANFEAFDVYSVSPVTISALTLGTTAAGAGTAILLDFKNLPPGENSINQPTVRIFDVQIRPSSPAAPNRSWHRGIELNDAWNASLSTVFIHGENGGSRAGSTACTGCLLKTGILLKKRSMDVTISDSQVFGAVEYAIKVEAGALSEVEGPKINNLVVTGAWTAIYSGTVGAFVGPTPWIAITNSHLSVNRRGIVLNGHSQATITGNTISKDAAYPAEDFVGVSVGGTTTDTRITANFVSGILSGPYDYGILVDASEGTITGNTFADAEVGIWIVSGRSGWTVTGNRGRNMSAAFIQDFGIATQKAGNNPAQ